MSRRRITGEMIAEWVQLLRKGQSYRGIAREFGVDPRTVKSQFQKAIREKEKEHWEAVSRQVDVKYLDEHYRILIQVAVAILDAGHTDPVRTHHELDADYVLEQGILSAMQGLTELLEKEEKRKLSSAGLSNSSYRP